MIKLQLLTEGRYDYGCVMARIDEKAARIILDFNYKVIGDHMIYEEEGHEYGREIQPHITLKYGLVNSYTEEQMKKILQHVIPFDVIVKGMSVFENDKYDVVKFDVDGKELHDLNEIFSKLPNNDEHPEYHPHMTLAYVHKGMGHKFVRNPKKIARILVNMIEYSDKGVKSHYVLNEIKTQRLLYHGTSEEAANRAWKNGLIPWGGINPKLNFPHMSYTRGVYLTNNINVAKEFGLVAGKHLENVVILTIDTRKLDSKKMRKDPMMYDSYVYTDEVPPEAIVNWKPAND
jgi:hypothetical protein